MTFLAVGMGLLALCAIGLLVTISIRLTVFDLNQPVPPMEKPDDQYRCP